MKLILSHKYGKKVRGSYKVSERFCAKFDDLCIKSDTEITLEEADEYDHVFFRTQVPGSYAYRLGMEELSNNKNTFFIRSEHNKPFARSATNGFSYYKEHGGIKYFCPFITDFFVNSVCENLTIGFYIRKGIAHDSYMWFDDFLRNLKVPINIYTMGDYTKDLSVYRNVSYHRHTNDNLEFFSNISHYVYPKSCEFVDPFPHTMLEAAQNGIQVITPSLGYRPFRDGIDDLMSVVMTHSMFDPDKILPRTDISFDVFSSFYKKALDTNLSYDFDRNKYKTFYDWIVGEVV